MNVLGIESTAHTFGASISSNYKIISNVNSTYRPPAGIGIHPRKASEHHTEVSEHIVKQAIPKDLEQVDAVAYAAGPGLGPCLRIGATVSRALASYLEKPLIPVHHGVAHLDIAMNVSGSRDPLAVLVSGGHTAILVHAKNRWSIYGETQDITLGNLLDMFGREAKLPAPSGRSIETLAKKSNGKLVPLPYTVKGNDVAYSGLLTAAKNSYHKGIELEDLCYSLQEVGFSMLVEAVERSLVQTRKKEILVAGGVAANSRLKQMLEMVAKDHNASFHPVPIEYSGDCGAQIACGGELAYEYGVKVPLNSSFVYPRWRIDEVDVPWVPRPSI